MTTEKPAASNHRAHVRRLLAAFGPAIGLVFALTLFASLRFSTFVTVDNFAIMLQQTAVIGAAAIGMTVIIVSGGIDLAVGSTVALVTIVVALLLKQHWGPTAAALGGIAAGGGCGLLTGTLVTRLRLMPFIVTLGLMGALRGAAKGLANEQPIYPDETWLNQLMQLGVHGTLPLGVWLAVVLAVLVALMLRYTRFGRHVFAIGSNEQTARLCGVPIERQKILIYVVGGLFGGVAGVLQFAYLTGGDPTTAVGLELNVIAAVVIGGTSIMGGRGSVLGTLLGALLVQSVTSGVTQLGWSSQLSDLFVGIFIVVAVGTDLLRARTRRTR
jgi:ribose/xylose/arabinose/galactoside ABC-type transport system permease subunit